MLYLLVKLNFFPQLETLNPDLTRRISQEIAQAGAHEGFPLASCRGGFSLFRLGPAGALEPEKTLSLPLRVRSYLEKHREDLLGYNLLLADVEEGPAVEVEAFLKHQLLRVEAEEEIWLDAECRAHCAAAAETVPRGSFWYIPEKALKSKRAGEAARSPWVRTAAVERVLDSLDINLDREAGTGILLVVDALETERKLLMDHVLSRLFGTDPLPPVPRLVTLFRRRSPLHPFLNSIEPTLLAQTPRYLKPVEAAIWKEVGEILSYLKYGGEGLCPDHLPVEYHLAYHLYLLAYVRSMEEKALPAVFVAEDVDTYHPAALASLLLFLHDLSHRPSFLPVLVASQAELPAELQSLRVKRLFVRRMSRGEIGELAARLYPGLEIPQAAVSQIRKVTGGEWISLCHYLEYLHRAGKIARREDRFSWVSRRELNVPFPARPLLATWSLIESLPEPTRRVLAAVYKTAGLLDRVQLFSFLDSLGMGAEAVRRGLRSLREYGLIHGSEYLLPVFPHLKGRVEALVDKEGSGLEDPLFDYLREGWEKGAYAQPVLLYTYSIRKKRGDLALELLPRLLRRRLDERDLEGAGLFLNVSRLGFEEQLSAEQRERLRLLLAASRLRAALLADKAEEAQRAAALLEECRSGELDGSLRAGICLELSRYQQALGQSGPALDWAKRSLMECQELALPMEERRAFLEIGAIMLAQGRLEESLEYLAFAEGFDRSAPLEEIRALGLRAIALFVAGNLSQARVFADRASEAASSARRREWEVRMSFLKGRILFDLGHYREALKEFQGNLAASSLFGLKPASAVLYSWMGRTLGYCGETESALRLLRQLEDGPEKMFFQGEVLYRAGDVPSALAALERASALWRSEPLYCAERIDWRTGHTAIEGCCSVLWEGRGLLGRLLSGFQALLRGREGIDELHTLLRDEKVPDSDPYLGLYHYFYARVLPEERRRETDDIMTVLNRALKILQQRAARMEDSTDRYHYLHRNYWNHLVLEDAARKKLI